MEHQSTSRLPGPKARLVISNSISCLGIFTLAHYLHVTNFILFITRVIKYPHAYQL